MSGQKRKLVKDQAELESLCRAFTRKNVETLGGWATGENIEPDLKFRAINVLLDRGWGKAIQPQDNKHDHTGAVEIIIRDIAAERAALKK